MQLAAGEAVRKGKHVLLQAPTGTGKTLAYQLALAQILDIEGGLQAIVVLPSRELAQQSREVWRGLRAGLHSVCLHGGRPLVEDAACLSGKEVQILFATPGRLCDLLRHNMLQSREVTRLVVDEVDKCLELGFAEEMRYVLETLSEVKQVVFTSATVPERLKSAFPANDIDQFQLLDFSEEPPSARLCEHTVACAEGEREAMLVRLLGQSEVLPAIVFVRQREDAVRLNKMLRKAGCVSVAYHGALGQEERERALFCFRAGCAHILVATDLAARGLDIPAVRSVVHYEDAEDVARVHRNGRATRWHNGGNAYYFAPEGEALPNREESVAPQMAALFIGRGRRDKVSRGDIVGFLCRQCGVPASSVGLIEVKPQFAYCAVSAEFVTSIVSKAAVSKLKGRHTKVEPLRYLL